MGVLAGWTKRQKISVDHTLVDADCSNFPVKVIVPSTNALFDTAKSDGADVRFTSSNGTTLLDFGREVHLLPDLWYQFSGSSVPSEFSVGSEISSATVTDGKLVLVPNSDCWNDYTNACVELDVNLTGDFDIQVDLEWVGQSYDQAGQYLQIVTASEYVGIGMRDAWIASPGMISVIGDTAGALYSGEEGDLTESGSANLRIYRDGTTVYFLWNGAQKASYSCSDTVTSLRLTNTTHVNEYKTAKWDNLMIFDSAGNLNMSSYSSEAKDLGIAVYHVEVPLVSSTSDTDFYMYYGNASATDASSPSDVWDSDYKLVMHMDDSLEDSTSNSNDGTNYGSGLGLTSDGYYRSFDGVDDYVSIPHDTSIALTENLTIEVCFSPYSTWDTPSENKVLFHKQNNSDDGYLMRVDSSTGKLRFGTQGGNLQSTKDSWSSGTKFYVACSYKNVTDSGDLFVDGSKEVLTVDNPDSMDGGTHPANIGGHSTNGTYSDVDISEVRLSSTARSDAWIKATAESLADNLVSFGEEEDLRATLKWVILV